MSQISILVVDDEKEIADLVEIYLVSDGYRVFKADNAQAGLDILDKEEVHLVLLDIMMPGMDGLEMCKRIRETNNIPIIMLSARSTDLDKILGLGTGADDYVVKPFNPLELTARVKSQLRRYTQLNPNSGAKEADKNEINVKVAALRDKLQNGSVEELKAGMDDLQKAIYAVSEKLYQQAAPQGNPGGPVPPQGPAGPEAPGGDGNVYDADFKDVN